MSPFASLLAEPAPKAHRAGTHRLVPPAETLARALPLMAEFGITRIANVTGLDRIGLPVVMVVRPNARSIAVAQGKGLDLPAAKASGLMEALEIAHAEAIEAPLRLASARELGRQHRLIELDRLARLGGSRYQPELRLLWQEGWDLLGQAPVWLPYECVHADFTLPMPTGSGCFPASTNGLASGNHLLEAICHGIAEVIERDALSLWHRRSRAARAASRIDLASIEQPAARAVLAQLATAGLEVALWDITSDLGVPACRCVIEEPAGRAGHLGVGSGCHPERSVALLRALTEAVQVRMTYITGARDDLARTEYGPARQARDAAYRQLLTGGGEATAGRAFADLPSADLPSFAEDLAWLLGRLQAAGISQVVAVDLTLPALGLPVVKIVIPGLEGADDDEAYVPGPRVHLVMSGRGP